MTAGEVYHLHCPFCGEEIDIQMDQAGQELLAGRRTCECGQSIAVTDRREMNVSVGESIARGQRTEISIRDGVLDGDA